MDVENSCMNLIPILADIYDKKRKGYTIDIGVGTFCFYCELFKKTGFKTIGIEPLPNDKLKNLCRINRIDLLECCIYSSSGKLPIYIGQFQDKALTDVSSLKENWWGSSRQMKMVSSITLPELYKMKAVKEVTFMKIDTEGCEYEIISQIKNIEKYQIPLVLQFEYGGGCEKKTNKGGWAKEYFMNTIKSLEALSELGYRSGLVIENAADHPTYFEFDASLLFDALFMNNFVWGNIIVFKEVKPELIQLLRSGILM